MEQSTQDRMVVRTGALAVNLEDRLDVTVDDVRIRRLSKKEYGILRFLSLHKGTTQTRKKIMQHLYGDNEADWPMSRTIDVFIHRLRKKLDSEDQNQYIDMIGDTGYVLRDPVLGGRGAFEPLV